MRTNREACGKQGHCTALTTIKASSAALPSIAPPCGVQITARCSRRRQGFRLRHPPSPRLRRGKRLCRTRWRAKRLRAQGLRKIQIGIGIGIEIEKGKLLAGSLRAFRRCLLLHPGFPSPLAGNKKTRLLRRPCQPKSRLSHPGRLKGGVQGQKSCPQCREVPFPRIPDPIRLFLLIGHC